MAKSTNKNYLTILGSGEGTLYLACQAMEGLEPNGVTMARNFTRGCVILGPADTDTERCVVLATGYKDAPEAWSLIDYRTAISDKDRESQVKVLIEKLDPRVRDLVEVESTQDHEFRRRAVEFRRRSLGQ